MPAAPARARRSQEQLGAACPARGPEGRGALEPPARLAMPACLTPLPSPPAWHSQEEACQEPSPTAKQEIII